MRSRPGRLAALGTLLAMWSAFGCASQSSRRTISPSEPEDTLARDTTIEEFVPFTEAPELLNPERLQRTLARHYPDELEKAGVGGRTVVYVFVDAEGNVPNALVHESSGNKLLDEAALAVARELRFRPARLHDKIVPVWISMPIVFEVRR